MTEFAPITRQTLGGFLKMRLKDGQDEFVAPNAVTIAESIYEKGSEVYGIFEGQTPVGLAALIDLAHPEAFLHEGEDPNGVYLWRLSIDGAHQGQGHGRAALDFAVSRAGDLGRAYVSLTANPQEGTPIPFYEKYGFSKTGRVIDGEVELALRLN